MHPMGVNPSAWRVHNPLGGMHPPPFLPPGGVVAPGSSVMYPHPTCSLGHLPYSTPGATANTTIYDNKISSIGEILTEYCEI